MKENQQLFSSFRPKHIYIKCTEVKVKLQPALWKETLLQSMNPQLQETMQCVKKTLEWSLKDDKVGCIMMKTTSEN